MTQMPNKPDAVNPAIAPRFQVGREWRGVTDPVRSKPSKGSNRKLLQGEEDLPVGVRAD